MSDAWVPDPYLDTMEHLNCLAWHHAPKPGRLHRCTPQTRGYTNRDSLLYVERCACGAIRLNRDGPWIERNSR